MYSSQGYPFLKIKHHLHFFYTLLKRKVLAEDEHYIKYHTKWLMIPYSCRKTKVIKTWKTMPNLFAGYFNKYIIF